MYTKEERKTQRVAHLVCGLFTALALLPFILMVVISFTDNSWASVHGYTYFPGAWSLDAYTYITAKWDTIGRAYLMTIVVTVIGTLLSLFLSCTYAYAISQQNVPGMRVLNLLLVITMLFSGGIVASYYCYVKIFAVKDTIAGLIVPNMLMNAFYVILIRNYYVSSIPSSLIESARVDGADEFTTYCRIVFPLSKPIVATVGLMVALGFWNDWVNGMYYLTERKGSGLYTIQIVLNKINDNIQTLKANAGELAKMGTKIPDMPGTTIRMAIAVVGILPILLAYPFFQKYFIKGITMGAVKE